MRRKVIGAEFPFLRIFSGGEAWPGCRSFPSKIHIGRNRHSEANEFWPRNPSKSGISEKFVLQTGLS